MSKLKFHKKGESRAGKLFLVINFAGGDADTEHPQEYEYKGLYYDQVDKYEDRITSDIAKYKILKDILDVNSGKFEEDYEEVKEKYGPDIARLFDNAPNDPQNDYQNKCYIDTVIVRGYDDKGTMYETYDLT